MIKDFVMQTWLNFCWFMFVCAKDDSSIEDWWNYRCCDVQFCGYKVSRKVERFASNFAVKVLGR